LNLVGIMPDMKSEPPINIYLNPLVEVKTPWSTGFHMFSYKSPRILKCFKLSLICVGCDIPASDFLDMQLISDVINAKRNSLAL
jgi:hypothetical protein